MKLFKFLKKLVVFLLVFSIIVGIYALIVNSYVVSSAKKEIISPEEAADLTDVDCIIVLGCLVRPSGKPSDMLADRLRRGVELYENGAAPKILMSGDHGQKEYNEVQTMKQYALDAGIESSDIFMDHAGFCTYDSIYRAKEIFGAKKIIIVSQEYHLHRALLIARKLGVEAVGVASDYHTYGGQTYRDIREIIARNKDFLYTIIKPKPKYLGEAIPINGDGNLTQD
jgi:vancomycin permeability regulator SanA